MSKQLVLAFFADETAADVAADVIKQWDKASKEIKLGAIGVLVKDDQGKIKTHKLGARKTGTGAVLFGLAAVLTGGASLLAGAVFGGILGSFFRKGLGMSKDDLARIDSDLSDGKAAVAILASPDEAAAVSAKLTDLGGVLEVHEISDAAVEEAVAGAEEAPAEEAEEATAEDAPAEDGAEAAESEEAAEPEASDEEAQP